MARKLSDWIQSYMDYSGSSEAPDKFHFWTAVSVIAGALRRRVWIDMGYFQWTPNFYIVFVAPPGIVSKSTTANIGMSLLRDVPGISFGPDVVTWQALVSALGDSTETVEINGMHHSMSAVTIVSSEFGTFLNPNDREMVDTLVSLWDGQVGVFTKHTKTQGSDAVENPWINILACTTPAWIAGNFPEYMIGGGFTSRTVFVYAEKKRRLIAYPSNHIPPEQVKLRADLVHDLEHIATHLKGEYKLTPEARQWGETWYERHYERGLPAHLTGERFGGYLARKQTHMHKLALVLAASSYDEPVITREVLAAADGLITANEHDMPKVFANIGKTDMTRAISELINLVISHQKIPLNTAYKQFENKITYQEYEIVVQSAIKAGHMVLQHQGTTQYLIATRPPEASVENESSRENKRA